MSGFGASGTANRCMLTLPEDTVRPFLPFLQLAAAVLSLSRRALQLLDLRQHTATHPRLGAVDHVSVHPLGGLVPRAGHAASTATTVTTATAAATATRTVHCTGSSVGGGSHGNTSSSGSSGAGAAGGGGPGDELAWVPPPPGEVALAEAAACARLVAEGLAEHELPKGAAREGSSPGDGSRGAAGKVGAEGGGVPVYLYGRAHPANRSLAEIRRQLGEISGWIGVLLRGHETGGMGLGKESISAGVATNGAVRGVVQHIATTSIAFRRWDMQSSGPSVLAPRPDCSRVTMCAQATSSPPLQPLGKAASQAQPAARARSSSMPLCTSTRSSKNRDNSISNSTARARPQAQKGTPRPPAPPQQAQGLCSCPWPTTLPTWDLPWRPPHGVWPPWGRCRGWSTTTCRWRGWSWRKVSGGEPVGACAASGVLLLLCCSRNM